MTYTKYQIPNTGLRGFTLIESLVAVAILALAVAGPLVTAGRALVATQLSVDQLTASYLAQEGIEYVRALRDNKYLESYPNDQGGTVSWTNFKADIEANCSSQSAPAEKCTVDPIAPMGYGGTNSVISYPAANTAPPLYRTSAGRYTQVSAGNTQTLYTRTIQVTATSGTDERIVSTVSWPFRGTTYSITVSDNLTPWQ